MTSILTNGALTSAGRGAATSRVLTFSLSQFGIADDFRRRLAGVVRAAPFDPYDIAMAAERALRQDAPSVYEEHEEAWLRAWGSLRDTHDVLRGATFWADKVAHPAIRMNLRRLRPFRQRCCRRYFVSGISTHEWRVVDLGTPAFTQLVQDNRARVRHFPSLPDEHVHDPELLQFLATACEMVSRAPYARVRDFQVTVHLMLTHADEQGRAPAPEGMHQDGTDYIISGLVLERENVRGGASVIVSGRRDGPPVIDSIELREGQGILQADVGSGLYHGVSPVHINRSGKPAFRSILGLDIEFARNNRR